LKNKIYLIILIFSVLIISSCDQLDPKGIQKSGGCGECTEWIDGTCGSGDCEANEMKQGRQCYGDFFMGEMYREDQEEIPLSPRRPQFSIGNAPPGCEKRCIEHESCVDCYEDCAQEGCEGQSCSERGHICISGACSCHIDLFDCNGYCIDPMTDENHCGGCNIPCSAGQACYLGTCFAQCEDDGDCPGDNYCIDGLCASEEICDNEIDDDLDGDIDCLDSDCSEDITCICIEPVNNMVITEDTIFCPGEYELTNGLLRVEENNVKITCLGTIIRTDDSYLNAIIRISGEEENILEGVTLEGCTIINNNLDAETIRIWYARGIEIKSNHISGGEMGITINDAENFNITGNTITNSAYRGISISHDSLGENNVVGNTITYASADGIIIYNGENFTVNLKDNTIKDNIEKDIYCVNGYTPIINGGNNEIEKTNCPPLLMVGECGNGQIESEDRGDLQIGEECEFNSDCPTPECDKCYGAVYYDCYDVEGRLSHEVACPANWFAEDYQPQPPECSIHPGVIDWPHGFGGPCYYCTEIGAWDWYAPEYTGNSLTCPQTKCEGCQCTTPNEPEDSNCGDNEIGNYYIQRYNYYFNDQDEAFSSSESCRLLNVKSEFDDDESVYLDYIIDDALDCCKNNGIITPQSSLICQEAKELSEEVYPPILKDKVCLREYIQKNLDIGYHSPQNEEFSELWMWNYFWPEYCCEGGLDIGNLWWLAGACSQGQGEVGECSPDGDINNSNYPYSDFANNLDCPGTNNLCRHREQPAKTTLSKLKTGVCDDWAFASFSLMRKTNEFEVPTILAVGGDYHAWNLIYDEQVGKYVVYDYGRRIENPRAGFNFNYCDKIGHQEILPDSLVFDVGDENQEYGPGDYSDWDNWAIDNIYGCHFEDCSMFGDNETCIDNYLCTWYEEECIPSNEACSIYSHDIAGCTINNCCIWYHDNMPTFCKSKASSDCPIWPPGGPYTCYCPE
jgi:parallel beta-helix repeat protein